MIKSTILNRLVMLLVVIVALYLYYPLAYRAFATMINADWLNSTGQATAGNYVSDSGGRNTFYSDFLNNIIILMAFIGSFFALPGVFLIHMWKMSKKLGIDSSRSNRSRERDRRKTNRSNGEVDEKSLIIIYNQLRQIELEVDSKFQSLREELLTEINSEIHRMFDMKAEAENCVEKARTLLKTKNYDEALKACNKAVELTPFGAAYYVRGAVYHKMGIDEQSINDLNTAAILGYQKAQDALSVMRVAS